MKSALLAFCSTLLLFIGLGPASNIALAQHRFAPAYHAAHAGAHFYGGHYSGHYGWQNSYWGHPHYGWRYPYYPYGWGFTVGFGWIPYAYGPAYPYYGMRVFPPFYGTQYRAYHNCSCVQGEARDRNREHYAPGTGRSVPRPPSTAVRPVPPANQSAEPPAVITPDDRAWELNQASLRRPVQNALRTLRAMPPEARQRWVTSGRFGDFSAQEKALLMRIALLAPASYPAAP